ncbi:MULTISPECIES: TRAP transporter small permease [Pseudorhizobium]|uniref:TRAP transporter small permease protein n=2 Tax=Pseudorhizobium TaxID=1903858 RepID=A0A7X0DEC0_9HYPH|nr:MULTISPECIES: TRAP transporter small permease subunit [Pseudorhizobium]MBB6179974.1 TRAP-type C4-dicarboxylate transport system permease small subunit [Pseudorhizobium flavum]CAD6598578.1 C4-dicarboxylate ABC transporter permease [Pseudorhizobium flavum]CAD6615294.1 C4-dicarboxylate ABC transporter permease [Rhizobium sp. Khangiran2]CAD7041924.1 C4-dicarboxylate ABC transporter permease [Pseudorhizobium halotolerans]
MNTTLATIGGWLRRRAENILCLMLLMMFVVFILQIIFRYVLNLSIGWTHEVSVALWIWIVLFGSAFVVREVDEIRFDLIWGGASDQSRRIMQIICAAALIFLFGISLPAIVDYVTFMKVESTAYLKIRFDYLYSIYVVFAIAMIVRYMWLGFRAIRGNAPDAFDPTKAGSGV